MTKDETPSALDVMRGVLRTELPTQSWALDRYVEDTPCLVQDERFWVGGFFERGSFDVRFRTASFDEAVALFTSWVRSVEESTRLSAEATARWLEQHGKTKP